MSRDPHRVSAVGSTRRDVLTRRIRLLVVFTITYNLVEGVAALGAGSVAGSVALLGFGVDSLIEMSSALVVAWQFSGRGGGHEMRERRALRLVALSFFALTALVSVTAVAGLVTADAPEPSTVGIVIATVSLLVMPTVSLAQRGAGAELGARAAVADAKQTLLCCYMSAVLLLALVANSVAGWWWADALGALAIAALAVREGRLAWQGDTCCPALLTTAEDVEAEDSATLCGAGCVCSPSPRGQVLGRPDRTRAGRVS